MDLIAIQPLWQEMYISIQAHVSVARTIASELAARLEFPKKKVADIVLSVSEMAQNHVTHHTISGKLRFFGQHYGDCTIMRISSLDMGPGIPRLRKALQDGHSSSNGLGSGLGCIKRISDRFAICSGKFGDFPCPDLLNDELESVTMVSAEFYSGDKDFLEYPVDFSYIIRPATGELYSGDGFYFNAEGAVQSMVVIDALGHGKEAAESVAICLETLRRMPANANPLDLLLEVGRALVHFRGIAAHALRIDTASHVVDAAAVGNVNQYLYLDGRPVKVEGHSGVLGPVISRSGILQARFENFDSVLGIISTDGIGKVPRLRFSQSETSISSLLWTEYLFSCCNMGQVPADDATLVVWKWPT